MCVQPVPRLLQEACFQRDGRLPRWGLPTEGTARGRDCPVRALPPLALQPPEPHFSPCPLPGHGLLFKTKLERSLAWKAAQPRLQDPQQAGPGEPGSLPEVGSALA